MGSRGYRHYFDDYHNQKQQFFEVFLAIMFYHADKSPISKRK